MRLLITSALAVMGLVTADVSASDYGYSQVQVETPCDGQGILPGAIIQQAPVSYAQSPRVIIYTSGSLPHAGHHPHRAVPIPPRHGYQPHGYQRHDHEPVHHGTLQIGHGHGHVPSHGGLRHGGHH